jgi:hypothetical protein
VASRLATQHRELMAQDENLEVFRGVTAGEPHEQLNGAAHGKVREFDSTEDGLRWGQERPQATEPRSGANQQVKGHVRVCTLQVVRVSSRTAQRRKAPRPRLDGNAERGPVEERLPP